MPRSTLSLSVLAVAAWLSHGPQVAALRSRPQDGVSAEQVQKDAAELLLGMSGSLDTDMQDVEEASYDIPDGRLVVVTSANAKYASLTRNLYASMKRVGRRKLVVFCEDAPCKRVLEGRGMYVVGTGNGFSEAGSYDSPSFNLITGRKPAYIYWFLSRGYTVLWTDGDVAWLSDPVPSLDTMGLHFIAQDDSKLRGENGVPVTAAISGRKANTGFLWVRPTDLGKGLVANWLLQMGSQDPKLQDQRVFQTAFRASCRRLCSEELGPCAAGDGADGVGVAPDCALLSRERCPNGSVPKWRWSKQALAYHANWHNGISAKVEQMKMKGLWSPEL